MYCKVIIMFPVPAGQPAQRPVMALVIRAIIVAGAATTGPAVNPMIAFAWASFVKEQVRRGEKIACLPHTTPEHTPLCAVLFSGRAG
jgi:hypothetical protein